MKNISFSVKVRTIAENAENLALFNYKINLKEAAAKRTQMI